MNQAASMYASDTARANTLTQSETSRKNTTSSNLTSFANNIINTLGSVGNTLLSGGISSALQRSQQQHQDYMAKTYPSTAVGAGASIGKRINDAVKSAGNWIAGLFN